MPAWNWLIVQYWILKWFQNGNYHIIWNCTGSGDQILCNFSRTRKNEQNDSEQSQEIKVERTKSMTSAEISKGPGCAIC